ncbi:hypothetical protein HMPREF9946_00659 [Acetobacteraceae bacterium AT-5844]|nr:hypothetical protein HMPREF9946_00659 [Acetobacteraceae bacterium AT-5844]
MRGGEGVRAGCAGVLGRGGVGWGYGAAMVLVLSWVAACMRPGAWLG